VRLLIAVTTCHARRRQADAQYFSWAKGVGDVRFFLGEGKSEDVRDVILPVDDSYQGLPAKVKATMSWARSNGYDAVFKVDDDVYVVPERLYRAGYERFDYVGNFRAGNGGYGHAYASGFAYWLGSRAVSIIADAPLTEDTFEDRWVGNTLGAITPRLVTYDEKRFACTYPAGIDAPQKLWSSVGRTHIALAQYPAHMFPGLHYWYKRIYDTV
jgi:hypothetical protein